MTNINVKLDKKAKEVVAKTANIGGDTPTPVEGVTYLYGYTDIEIDWSVSMKALEDTYYGFHRESTFSEMFDDDSDDIVLPLVVEYMFDYPNASYFSSQKPTMLQFGKNSGGYFCELVSDGSRGHLAFEQISIEITGSTTFEEMFGLIGNSLTFNSEFKDFKFMAFPTFSAKNVD